MKELYFEDLELVAGGKLGGERRRELRNNLGTPTPEDLMDMGNTFVAVGTVLANTRIPPLVVTGAAVTTIGSVIYLNGRASKGDTDGK